MIHTSSILQALEGIETSFPGGKKLAALIKKMLQDYPPQIPIQVADVVKEVKEVLSDTKGLLRQANRVIDSGNMLAQMNMVYRRVAKPKKK